MAGDWIKMDVNLDGNPRILGLAAELSVDPLHAIGMLWKIWAWADQHTLDGNAVCVTENVLDRFTNCPGFAVALRKVGWLEGRDSALTFPRFAEHNGQTAKNRALTLKRVRKVRNDIVTQTALPEEKRREEKRREEPPKSPKGDFAVFWAVVPAHKKQGKALAERSYDQTLRKLSKREKDPAEFLLDRATAYYASPLGQTPFCNSPTPFLNQGHYDDDPAAWQRNDNPQPPTRESTLPFFDEVKP